MPRDPKRIPIRLTALQKVWMAHPDWRLGQLIANASRGPHGNISASTLFNIEDDVLARRIEELLNAEKSG